MIVNGLSPGLAIVEPKAAIPDRDLLQKEELEQEIREERQKLEKAAQVEKPKKESSKTPDLDMNDYYMKELLFLMSSKGNSATIEKLAKLLKKERDTLTKIR
jgi:hypothetical protein